MREKLAIIGGGIAGLGAAYYLSRKYDVTLFEKNNYLGGHTNTISVSDGGDNLNIDTGFIVFNKQTYPNLINLLHELDVTYQTSNMSFSVYDQSLHLQYGTRNIGALFAQRHNLFALKHWKFLFEIKKFNKQAPTHLTKGLLNKPLSEYLSEEGYSENFIFSFIIPMGSAVWSVPFYKVLKFPAKTLVQFLYNHGFLGMNTQFQWFTITNGSKNYVQKILANSNFIYKLNSPIYDVECIENEIMIRMGEGTVSFDKVIVATHADQAFGILRNFPREVNILSNFKYEKNRAVLHTDSSVMPPLKQIWSSWNYKTKRTGANYISSTVYYMNLLQNLKSPRNFFISINEFDKIAPEKILYQADYEHPIFDIKAMQTQEKLAELNENGRVYFCGSYFKYGFHEDALSSALDVTDKLLARDRLILNV